MASICRTKFFYAYCSNLRNYKKENRNVIIYKKNDFAKISKNLARCRSESILHHQNNCTKHDEQCCENCENCDSSNQFKRPT